MMSPQPPWTKKLLVLDENCRPKWENAIEPRCSEGGCPAYDGKRCGLLGHRPGVHCEPAVRKMGEALRRISEDR